MLLVEIKGQVQLLAIGEFWANENAVVCGTSLGSWQDPVRFLSLSYFSTNFKNFL